MIKARNVTGFRKPLFASRVKLYILFYYLPDVIKGKVSFRRYILFLKRLLYFLSKIYHNKFVGIGNAVRLGLYIPRFPSKAFFTACRKFMVFDAKLPCTTALISVTSACRFNCEHCYQKKDVGKDIDIDLTIAAVKQLQALGVAFFNIEGGEPFLVYDRLRKLCASIDQGAEIWVNATGDGMSIERLKELKSFGLTAIMFSLHSADPEKVNAFMKSDKAWDTLIQGIRLCHEVDVAVAFNSCLKRDDFYNGNFQKVMDKAKELGACLVQIIKPKPSGGWLESGVESFCKVDLEKVKELVHAYNNDARYKDYPSISAQIIEEDAAVFGCTAGGTDRFYINAKGDVQPCEFLNISFGNIAEEEFTIIYNRMRSFFTGPGECWLCEKYSPAILQLLKENKLETLPLDEELARKIYSHWDRGKLTEMYRIIENRMK
ncbi:MAG: radical SAM protein [Candidatus Omnitrophota bacterium]